MNCKGILNPLLTIATVAGLVGATMAAPPAPPSTATETAPGASIAETSPQARYAAECGSCHLAYSPRLLPAQSWQRIMDGLANHFGDNAELDAQTQRLITDYLLSEAGSPRPNAPLRITEQRWFVHEHRELPSRMVVGNPQVRTLSNCAACHRQADRGQFDEHNVLVPGFGRWDD
jgi:hypothetical protein